MAVVSIAALSACGTVTQGGTQIVDVVVRGSPTAFCSFTTPKTRNDGQFPNKLSLERSKDDLTAECKGEQNLYKKFTIPSKLIEKTIAGNAPTAFIGQAYDAGTGGMWEYPDPLIVDFRNTDEGEGPKPAWPGDVADDTRIGTAQIAAPAPVRMQPVLDNQLNPNEHTEIIDAVRIAVDKQPQAIAVTKTTTTTPAKKSGARMKPIASPEDDPAVMKARQEAKAKAAAEARRKAAENKAAAKAAQEAREAAKAREAADAAAPVETPSAAPASEPAASPAETPPSDAALMPPASAPATDPAAAPSPETPPAGEPAPAPAPSSEMPPPADAPATTGQSTEMDKYLSGGR